MKSNDFNKLYGIKLKVETHFTYYKNVVDMLPPTLKSVNDGWFVPVNLDMHAVLSSHVETVVMLERKHSSI